MIVKKHGKELNKLLILNPQTSTKDCEIIYSVEVANAFNSYSSSLGNDLAKTIPSVGKKTKDYLHNCIQPSFFIFSTTFGEIEDEISKLKSGKSTGPVSVFQ